jgi:hypothetical protein
LNDQTAALFVLPHFVFLGGAGRHDPTHRTPHRTTQRSHACAT